MSDSISLPLRPLVEKRDHHDSLPVQIAQINAQWGAFRDVSEESLRAEIHKEKDADIEAEDGEKESADLDATERLEQLYKRRAEITQFALQAHMETMFALDFVSLLLSKHTPRPAETSMSAYLKQVAPLGTLNAEIVNPPPRPESIERDLKNVSRGWRLQSFNAAANKLLKSATRLEGEVAAETRYWNEVLAVKAKGWKVCRLPRERQALGVQFGFLEATPIFRDRGLAALRRAADGSLILDQGVVAAKPRMVRVRVKEGDQVTGCSTLMHPVLDDARALEGRILQARDTLYEEELFHELVREARIITSQGVTTRQNLVQFSVGEEQEILLDLVDVDQDSQPEANAGQHNTLADALAHSIRILLAYAHRQNLRRRTQFPPPVTPKRKHVPEYPLLRPVMAYLQHRSHVRYLESFLRDIYGVLKSAGLECGFTATPFSIKFNRKRIPAPTVESLVEQFLMPLESTFSGHLLTPHSSFGVKIRTNVSTPPLGTSYDISIGMPHYPDIQPPSRVGLKDEAAAVITHFIMLDIVSAIANRSKLSHPTPKRSWSVVYPHQGELVAESGTDGHERKMKVTLSRDELTVQIYSVGGGGGRRMLSHTWKSDATQQEQKALMDFVEASDPLAI